jgi:hypothetical protein
MPDWAREVRTRLSSLQLSPTRERESIEELTQHLDDRWRELMAGGASPDEASGWPLPTSRTEISWRSTSPSCGVHRRTTLASCAPQRYKR